MMITSPRYSVALLMLLFMLQPVATGGWMAMLPDVQASLGISKARLSLALLGIPAALMVTMPLAGRIVAKIGPRRLLGLAFSAQTLAILLPLLATSTLQLFFALAVFGTVLAFAQVSLNVYAGQLEKASGLLIMNRCHGFWAVGLMLGPLIYSVLPDLSRIASMLWIVGPVLPVALASVGLLSRTPAVLGSKPGRKLHLLAVPPALIWISIFVMPVAMSEGAMADWAAIYLSELYPGNAALAGIGVSVYAGLLALGRFLGDALKARFGAVALARATLSFALLGIALLALPMTLGTAFLAFGCVGIGASVGYPLAVSAVANIEDGAEGPYIAFMSLVAFLGFMIGPPIIGFLADALSLRLGLAALLPGLMLSWALARWLGRRRPELITIEDTL
jgi:MFS family permease